jgi:hypothetical protein
MILCNRLVLVVIFTFSSPILLIWVLSFLFWLVWLKVYQSYLSFQSTNFFSSLLWFLVCFFNSLVSALIFIISFCLCVLGLACSCFSKSLWCIIRLIVISGFFYIDAQSYKLSSQHYI